MIASIKNAIPSIMNVCDSINNILCLHFMLIFVGDTFKSLPIDKYKYLYIQLSDMWTARSVGRPKVAKRKVGRPKGSKGQGRLFKSQAHSVASLTKLVPEKRNVRPRLARQKAVSKVKSDVPSKDSMMREIGRVVSWAYESEKENRLALNNRIRDLIRKKNEKLPFDSVEERNESPDYDKTYADENFKSLILKLKDEGSLTDEEVACLDELIALRDLTYKSELGYKDALFKYIENEPLWMGFLSKVRGISVILTSSLLKRFGYCEKFAKPSSLQRYCGYHSVCPDCTYMKEFDDGSIKKMPVVASVDGCCPNCGKRGIAPKRRRGMGIDFNPDARTLIYKVVDSMIKQKSPIYAAPAQTSDGKTYNSIYHTYKDKQLQILGDKEGQRMHAHLRAVRKVGKLFLQHYWAAGRTYAGLEVRKPYIEEFGKDKHHTEIINWQDIVDANELLMDKGVQRRKAAV